MECVGLVGLHNTFVRQEAACMQGGGEQDREGNLQEAQLKSMCKQDLWLAGVQAGNEIEHQNV